MKKITIILGMLSLVAISFAKSNSDINSSSHASTSSKTNLSDCTAPTTQVDLDINNVRVGLLGAGDMWWDGDVARYEYPKIDKTSGAISKSVLFLGSLWFTGYDKGTDNIRSASQRYYTSGTDFWTGPVKIGGGITSDVCDDFDHHFVVYGEEIDAFKNKFELEGSIGEAEIPDNIKYWPGKGNPFLLNSTVSQQNGWYFNEGALAPFLDVDGNGIYSPLGGDYPVIKTYFDPVDNVEKGSWADQMIFWVINDVGNTHSGSSGAEIGLQINCLAFAFQTSDEINDMTFYTYEIFKKTAGDLERTIMSVNVDPDIGEFNDDFIGCDTVRSIGFCYNGNPTDAQYLDGPPIIGIDFFEGPIDDNGNELGLTSFMYYNNGSCSAKCDPVDVLEYRNYQDAKWKDHTEAQPHVLTMGGQGLTGTVPTRFVYPGNPGLGEYWSECNNNNSGAGNVPDDRRFVQSSGVFTLKSSQSQRISVGVMIAETDPATYQGCADFEALLGTADDKAQALFDNDFTIVDGPDAPDLKIRELDKQLIINLINKPGSNNFGEAYKSDAVGAAPTSSDLDYDFEGYKVYQLANANVTAKELNDPAKAKIVFKSDVKNGVTNVYNYEFDTETNSYVIVKKASGTDEGISRSFSVTEDLYATGESELVNYRNYYYAVVAYAYNNHKQFVQTDVNHSTSQLEQYLQGRRNFKVYSAIPHNIQSETGGTKLNSEYGQGLEVKRYEGSGNGGKYISLTQETIDDILIDGFKDILSYEPLKDPLGIKIIDPLAVKDVDFELRILNKDTSIVTDSSYWEMLVMDKSGTVIDTVFSNRSMDRPYEQIIEDYGIMVNVGAPIVQYTNLANGKSVYNNITSSISFVDESKKWLTFMKDESSGGKIHPSNWINSGKNKSYEKFTWGIFDAHQYDELANPSHKVFYDENDLFGNMLEGGFAPYCLSTNYKRDKSQLPALENGKTAPYSLFGPGFLWDTYNTQLNDTVFNPVNTLDNLQSIDIVMTPDKSKWTKCVVFETAEDIENTIGDTRKGQLRASNSIDEDGNEIVSETGRSYFPGYAINIETGERLNIAFGESSQRTDNNGGDMIWNPTSKVTDRLTNIKDTDFDGPVYGGKHFIYVFDTKYDEGAKVQSDMQTYYGGVLSLNDPIPTEIKELYKHIMYTSIPLLAKDFELLSLEEGLIPNADTIKIRVETPYGKFYTAETDAVENNDSMPRYGFSTMGMAPEVNVKDVAESALDNIRVVPNPYYAFSDYEVNQNSSMVKITNLPDVCTISIYTMDGKLVQKYDRAFGSGGKLESDKQDLSSAQVKGVFNLDNSQVWNLKNHKDIPVASGTYLIFIDAPDIGQKVVKAAVFIRPPDITNF